MSRRGEIFQRYQIEFQEASRRGRALHDEILQQERDVLETNVPAARAAIGSHAAAVADAFETFQSTIEKSELDLAAAEAEALDQQFPDQELARANWQRARDAAAEKRDQAIRKANAEFEAADRDARRLVGIPKDNAIAAARRARDDAHDKAAREFLAEDNNAFRDFQAADAAAREKAIAAIDGLRLKQSRDADAAAQTHQRAQQRAADNLEAALRSDPIAVAIHEAFQLRLADVDRENEREKQAILARMQDELKSAS